MSKTYSDLMQEIQALQAEAEQARRKEVDEVIERIKHAIKVYGLRPSDLGFAKPGRKPGSAAAAAPAPAKRGRKPNKGKGADAVKDGNAANAGKGAARGAKYRDGNNVWGGRGPRPRWLRDALNAGKSLQDFVV